MKTSAISWTDFSGGFFNFVTGCTQASEGCRNCCAKAMYDRCRLDFTPTVHPEKLARLKRWTSPEYSPKRGIQHKPMAFVCDTSDMFHDAFMTKENMRYIYDAMMVMMGNRQVTWQILTKRPENAKRFFEMYNIEQFGRLNHVWLGVSAENQEMADKRIPVLLSIPNVRHFVSIEPMLGPVNIWQYLDHVYEYHPCQLEWAIVGGESGPDHRPMREEWPQEIGEECYWANVPLFYKQDSALYPGTCETRLCSCREWPNE